MYLKLTEEERALARNTDLAEFLKSRGEILKRSGTEYEWRDGSEKVTIRGNLWYNQYEGKGGDAVDFVMKYFNKPYPEAVKFIVENGGRKYEKHIQKTTRKGEFSLPARNKDMLRVYCYLHINRGIDIYVLQEFINRRLVYEEADFHNAVFVGTDSNGVPRHACLRGNGNKFYKGNAANSLPEYSFHYIGEGGTIYLFESPIDMLSYISMHKENWQENSYAAACSVSDKVLLQCLKDYPKIQKVYVCFDSDLVGQIAGMKICDKLQKQNIEAQILVPKYKDWNEDLQRSMKKSEAVEKCPE